MVLPDWVELLVALTAEYAPPPFESVETRLTSDVEDVAAPVMLAVALVLQSEQEVIP